MQPLDTRHSLVFYSQGKREDWLIEILQMKVHEILMNKSRRTLVFSFFWFAFKSCWWQLCLVDARNFRFTFRAEGSRKWMQANCISFTYCARLHLEFQLHELSIKTRCFCCLWVRSYESCQPLFWRCSFSYPQPKENEHSWNSAEGS